MVNARSGRATRSLKTSFAQERLWFLDQLQPGSQLYNIDKALHLRGPLNPSALQSSFSEIVRRHDSLRTTFGSENGVPVQRVGEPSPHLLPTIDLEALSAAERGAVRLELTRRLRAPFDLRRGPLLRTVLLRLAADDHWLVLSIHHVVSDAWSIEVLLRELLALYEAALAGRPSPLPPLPIQYVDYAYWQRDDLTGERLEEQVAYWRDQLAEAPSILELPADRPRPVSQSFRGAIQLFRLSPRPLEALKRLSAARGATLFMTLLAAFKWVLRRYSGQDRVVVGTPMAGRTRVEIEPLIGFFVNTMALHTDLSGDPSFAELVDRVAEVTTEAYGRQDLPFDRLVEELRPERNLSYNPLFQVMFSLEMVFGSEASFDLGDAELRVPFSVDGDPAAIGGEADGVGRWGPPIPATSKVDLTLLLAESDGRLLGSVEYATDLFDAVTVRRLVETFETFLGEAAARPEARISSLATLPPSWRQQLRSEWNDTGLRRSYPRDACLHQLLEAQQERTPDSVAVVFEDQHVSYAEIHREANRLAHYLVAQGVGPEVRVGLCIERSPRLVTTILGVLKAGGAYVPLDPSYPADRLRFMLAESEVPVIVAETSLADDLPAHSAKVLWIDRDWPEIARLPSDPPASGVTADNLAYIMYTSGTTGRPKGIMVVHRGVCNTSEAQIATLGVAQGVRPLQFASPSFNVSIYEIMMAMRVGGTSIMARQDDLLPGPPLVEVMRRERVSAVVLTSSVLSVLPQEELPHVEIIVAGMEPVATQVVAQWAPGRRFFDCYGLTEASIWVTAARCRDGSERPPIGFSIPNVQSYALDAAKHPVPIGVSGEHCVGGLGLGRGYLNQPGATARSFIPDLFGGRPGARLYRSGDWVRRRVDGKLHCLGRMDHQIKIRGFRIEPGEVETVLMKHRQVHELVVVIREDSGDKRLVAYTVPKPGVEVSIRDLRAWVKESLPDYMVPAFVLLDDLPRSPNGKIDRSRLPAPDVSRPDQGVSYQAPQGELEEVLVEIWEQTLGLERVGAKDSFFELGGHSLLATQVISRVRERLGVELPLRYLFEAPTVAELAPKIELLQSRADAAAGSRIQKIARDDEAPLTWAQERWWWLDRAAPGCPAYNIVVPLRLPEDLDEAALATALRDLVERHEALRTSFPEVAGRPVQRVARRFALPLPRVDLTHLAAPAARAEARRVAVAEGRRSFDLANGPLLRLLLVRPNGDDPRLVLSVHHAVFDGWSMGVLHGELLILYMAAQAQMPAALPEPESQLSDFASWQRHHLEGAELDALVGDWRERLHPLPGPLALRAARPRTGPPSFRGSSLGFSLPEALARQLEALSAVEDASLFMVLLCAFQILLHRESGQHDLVVGTQVANRTRPETENVVGCFADAVALRTDLSGDPTARQLLARVKDVTLGALAHPDVPFARLVDELGLSATQGRDPLFQAMFNFQNVPLIEAWLSTASLPAAAEPEPWTAEEIEIGTSRYDLTLVMAEHQNTLVGAVEYDTDLFRRTDVERMVGDFEKLLASVASRPDRRLSELV